MIDWHGYFGGYAEQYEQAFEEMTCPFDRCWFELPLLVSKQVKATLAEDKILNCLKMFKDMQFGDILSEDSQERMKEAARDSNAEGYYRVDGKVVVIIANAIWPTMICFQDEADKYRQQNEDQIDYSIYTSWEEHFRSNYEMVKSPVLGWFGHWLLISKKVTALMQDKEFEEGIWNALRAYADKNWGDGTDPEDCSLLNRWCAERGKSEGRYYIKGQKIVFSTEGPDWPTIILLPEER